jgi:hypothetical protein
MVAESWGLPLQQETDGALLESFGQSIDEFGYWKGHHGFFGGLWNSLRFGSAPWMGLIVINEVLDHGNNFDDQCNIHGCHDNRVGICNTFNLQVVL